MLIVCQMRLSKQLLILRASWLMNCMKGQVWLKMIKIEYRNSHNSLLKFKTH